MALEKLLYITFVPTGVVIVSAEAATLTSEGYFEFKEQVLAVQDDAIDYLAGFEQTEALHYTITELRQSTIELHDLTDKEIASLILTYRE